MGMETKSCARLTQCFPGESLGDFLLAPVCPIEKVILRVARLYVNMRYETDRKIKPGILIHGPVHYSPSHRFTPVCVFVHHKIHEKSNSQKDDFRLNWAVKTIE